MCDRTQGILRSQSSQGEMRGRIRLRDGLQGTLRSRHSLYEAWDRVRLHEGLQGILRLRHSCNEAQDRIRLHAPTETDEVKAPPESDQRNAAYICAEVVNGKTCHNE